MKNINIVLCWIACVAMEILMHIVSFNIFQEATLIQYSILLVVAALQAVLIYMSWKRKAARCFNVFLIVFLISLAYDAWTVILEMQSIKALEIHSEVSRRFDVILVAALIIDLFLLSLTLVLNHKEKHTHDTGDDTVGDG